MSVVRIIDLPRRPGSVRPVRIWFSLGVPRWVPVGPGFPMLIHSNRIDGRRVLGWRAFLKNTYDTTCSRFGELPRRRVVALPYQDFGVLAVAIDYHQGRPDRVLVEFVDLRADAQVLH